MLLLLLCLAPGPLVVLCLVLAWRYHRVRKERDDAMNERDGLAALSCEIHQANYRLACELYGQPTVDGAIRKSHTQGKN